MIKDKISFLSSIIFFALSAFIYLDSSRLSDFAAVLGKVSADLGSLVLFWFQGSLFGRFWAMLRQVGQDGDQERQDGRTWAKHGVAIDAERSSVDAKRSGPELLGPL